MSYKPILFNTEMVQAIMEGRKTQTRRVAFLNDSLREFHTQNYPEGWWYEGRVFKNFEMFIRNPHSPRCKYKPGDILWVRETFDNIPISPGGHFRFGGMYYYRADGDIRPEGWKGNWHPSIHMPKEAARIFLRVKDVRVERLQDMTEEQAEKEGCSAGRFHITCGPFGNRDEPPEEFDAVEDFQRVWDSTIKPADLDRCGWDANPWVWVIEFEECERPEGW